MPEPMAVAELTTEVPWSLQSSRFRVEHRRMIVEWRNLQILMDSFFWRGCEEIPVISGDTRISYGCYTNAEVALAKELLQVTEINGTVPFGLHFSLSFEREGEATVTLWGLGRVASDCAFFVDVHTDYDALSAKSGVLPRTLLRKATRPRPCSEKCWSASVKNLGDRQFLDLGLYILHGIHLCSMARLLDEDEGESESHFPELNFDPSDFNDCWADIIDVVVAGDRFKIQKSLAEARIPWISKMMTSGMREATELQVELQASNVTSEAFAKVLSCVVGGHSCFAQWWQDVTWQQALDVLIAADFLGCDEIVSAVQCRFIHELRVTGDDVHVMMGVLAEMTEKIPSAAKLIHACLCTVALQVLGELCRQCNSLYLEFILRNHSIDDLQSLRTLVKSYGGPLMSLCDVGSGAEDRHAMPQSNQDANQRTYTNMQVHLAQAQERATKAEEELARLKEELKSPHTCLKTTKMNPNAPKTSCANARGPMSHNSMKECSDMKRFDVVRSLALFPLGRTSLMAMMSLPHA